MAPPRAVHVERIPLGRHATAGPLGFDGNIACVLDPRSGLMDIVEDSSRDVLDHRPLFYIPHALGISPDGHDLWIGLSGRAFADFNLGNARSHVLRGHVSAMHLAVLEHEVVAMATPTTYRGRLERIDVAHHRALGQVKDIRGYPTDVVTNGTDVFVLFGSHAHVDEYDASLHLKGSLRLPTDGVAVQAADDEEGHLYITFIQYDRVLRVNESRLGVDMAPIKVGHKPLGIAYDGETHSMWVANTGSRTLTQIDARTGRVLATVDAHGPLAGWIAARLGVVYAAGSNDVVRVDVVR